MLFVRSLSVALLCGSYSTAVAADAPARSALEAAVLVELNVLRADPPAYAAHLEAMRAQYRGTLLVRGAGLAPIKTEEGVAALEEAIADLKRAPRATTLSATAGLALAAHDMVVDEGPTGAVGHRGTDGSNSAQRITRHGKSRAWTGEVIDYGWDDARDIVVDLLIDDGVADRGHRQAVLSARYAQAGVSCGPHAKYGVMCVVDMAGDFVDASARTAAR